jgi:hypothetical protein
MGCWSRHQCLEGKSIPAITSVRRWARAGRGRSRTTGGQGPAQLLVVRRLVLPNLQYPSVMSDRLMWSSSRGEAMSDLPAAHSSGARQLWVQ